MPDPCGSLYSRRSRPCLHGAPVLMGMDVTERVTSWPLCGAAASWGLSDMKVEATQSPGGRGSEARGPQEEADLAGWRNSRKTSVSEENEQGDRRELVSEQWAGDRKWDGSLGWSRAEEGCGLMWEL